MVATFLLALAGQFAAQTPADRVRYTNLPLFTIPFTPMDGTSRVKQMQLWVSTDQGRSWQFYASATPTEAAFKQYAAASDGAYWFAVRTIDLNDQAVPPQIDGLVAQLKVQLDRKPPSVLLRAVPNPRPGELGVEWEVREENIDPARFTLDYRVPGQTDWLNQPVAASATGSQLWSWGKSGRMDVRLRVTDLAGNDAEQTVSLGSNGSQLGPATGGRSAGTEPTGPPDVRYINSPVIGIPYRIREIGVSKLSVFELWVTRDRGQRWERVPKAADAQLPDVPAELGETAERMLQFDTGRREGLYGFIPVVRSGVGLGDPDPKPGDPPRAFVEVDLTPPTVRVTARRGTNADVRNVVIQWDAGDKNLADRPVSLLIAETKDAAEWTPIATDLDKAGSYTYTVPDRGPFKFYVQAKAIDKAANTATAVAADQLVVDLSHPKVDIIDIKPVPESRPR